MIDFRCEAKGTHPAHDMFRISNASRNFPPHFFSRLQRFYDKSLHPQASGPSKSPLLEPMAKDLVDEDSHSDMDRFLTPDDNLEPESLPSIEELTKNVQNLIDKDLEESKVEIPLESKVEHVCDNLEASAEDVIEAKVPTRNSKVCS